MAVLRCLRYKYLQNNDHSRKITVWKYLSYKWIHWRQKYRQLGILGIFGRYSVFFGICYTDVGIGIGIWKYRAIGSVSVLPTQT